MNDYRHGAALRESARRSPSWIPAPVPRRHGRRPPYPERVRARIPDTATAPSWSANASAVPRSRRARASSCARCDPTRTGDCSSHDADRRSGIKATRRWRKPCDHACRHRRRSRAACVRAPTASRRGGSQAQTAKNRAMARFFVVPGDSGMFNWCPRGDSNPHDFRRYHLKVVRLPIPPPGLILDRRPVGPRMISETLVLSYPPAQVQARGLPPESARLPAAPPALPERAQARREFRSQQAPRARSRPASCCP